jgi:hypothetical protein
MRAFDVGAKGRTAQYGFTGVGFEQISQIGIASRKLLYAFYGVEGRPFRPQVVCQGLKVKFFPFPDSGGLVEHVFYGKDTFF